MTRAARWIWGLSFLFSLLYIAYIPVATDEAYYWNWSRHLALSYYDAPPMIAYLLRMMTSVFGTHRWSLELLAVLGVAASSWMVYKLADRMFSAAVAEKSLLIFVLLPVVQATNIISTPDVPLMFFWIACLYTLWNWLQTNNTHWLYFSGALLGCGLLAKYSMILLVPSIFFFLLCSKERGQLLNIHLYLALLLAMLIFSPVVIWNAQHHWLSFGFQWHHGVHASAPISAYYTGRFLLGELAAFNPVFLLLLAYSLLRYCRCFRDFRLQFLLWPFAVTFFFFFIQAMRAHSQMNWSLPAFISASILLAYFVETFRLKLILYGGVFLSLVAIVLCKFPMAFLNLPSDAIVIHKFFGYDSLIKTIAPVVPKNTVLLSDSYQNASELAFHLPNKPEVYVWGPGRASQYTLWSAHVKQSIASGETKSVCYFGESDLSGVLKHDFSSCHKLGSFHYKNFMTSLSWLGYCCQ